MASVALDLQLFRDLLVATLPLFPYSVRDNGPLICCQTDATDATIATRGLGMGDGGGIRSGPNVTSDAPAPGTNATFVHGFSKDILEWYVRCVQNSLQERYDCGTWA